MLLRALFIVSLLAGASALLAQPTVLEAAEVAPCFPGCDPAQLTPDELKSCSEARLAEFFSQNIIYPDTARRQQIEGTVVVRFVVDENGKVTQPELVRDVGGTCGEEVLRVVDIMPEWSPARQDGQPVAFRYTLPLRFNLKEFDERFAKRLFRVSWGAAYADAIPRNQFRVLDKQIPVVRDMYGEVYQIEAITVIYKTWLRKVTVVGQGAELTKRMKKMIRRAKARTHFTIVASIQDGTGRVQVARQFHILKDKKVVEGTEAVSEP